MSTKPINQAPRTPALFAALTLAALLAGPLAARATDPAPGAEAIVEQVQLFYAGVTDYRATFVQTTAHKMFAGRLQRSYGKVMFKQGGLMRWEYGRPDNKLFVYDGATLWIYEPEVPQVFSGTADAERLQKGLAFLTGQGKILDEYTALRLDEKRFGFAKGYVLKLRPKQKNSPFRHVELYVDKADYHVVRSVVVDHDNNRNRLDFGKPETNLDLPAGLFAFAPPAGVPVITGEP